MNRKSLTIQTINKRIGLLTGIVAVLLWMISYFLVKANLLYKESTAAMILSGIIFCSPLLAILITGLKLQSQSESNYSFGYWIKATFANFAITLIVLLISMVLTNLHEQLWEELLFRQSYLIILAGVIGLFGSVITTVFLKRNN